MEKLSKVTIDNIDLFSKIGEKNFRSWFINDESCKKSFYRGASPVEEIFSLDSMKVYKFKCSSEIKGKTPVLLVPSLINRAYVIDLMQGSSLAEDLSKSGLQTYLLEWGDPGVQHDHLPVEFFVDYLIGRALKEVCRDAGTRKSGLLGYCMGGTMCLIHTAMHPENIDRLTLLASPTDFHDSGTLSKWASKEAFDVDRMIDVTGHMDSILLQASFLWMKPLSYYQKLKHAYETCTDPKFYQSFVSLESWANDNVNFPGRAYADYIKLCCHENSLVNGRFCMGEHHIDLRNIECDILNVIASKDHIVTIESARKVDQLVTGKVEEVLIEAGHIGLVMGRRAKQMFESVAKFHLR